MRDLGFRRIRTRVASPPVFCQTVRGRAINPPGLLFEDSCQSSYGGDRATPEHERPLHEVGLNVAHLLHDGGKSIVTPFEPAIHINESAIDINEAAIDIVQAAVDAIQTAVDAVKAIVDTIKPGQHVTRKLVEPCLTASVIGADLVEDSHEFAPSFLAKGSA